MTIWSAAKLNGTLRPHRATLLLSFHCQRPSNSGETFPLSDIEIFSSLDFQIFFHRYWYTFLLGYPAISLPQSLERKILYCKVFCLEGLSNDIVVNAQQYLMIGPSFIKQVSSGKIPLTIWTSCTVPSTSYSNWTQIFLTTWTLLKVNPDHV